MATSFQTDIKPYFTATDQDHMSFRFDLWDASDVCSNYDDIREQIVQKLMPRPTPWDDAKIATFVKIFDQWKSEGCQP